MVHGVEAFFEHAAAEVKDGGEQVADAVVAVFRVGIYHIINEFEVLHREVDLFGTHFHDRALQHADGVDEDLAEVGAERRHVLRRHREDGELDELVVVDRLELYNIIRCVDCQHAVVDLVFGEVDGAFEMAFAAIGCHEAVDAAREPKQL